jgi:AAA+ superfamily predicted ATPase
MLALTPHLQPHLLDQIFAKVFPEGGELPLLGGVRSQSSRLFLPTGQTAAFILGGRDVEAGMRVRRMLSNAGRLTRMRLVWLESVPEGEPSISGRLGIDPDIVELLQLGSIAPPRFSQDFPAEYITTEMEWSDLILQDNTVKQIHEIQNWVTYNDTIMTEWGLGKRVKPGYRALFYGPPGTGKTLTATLLGKHTGRDVFRIDLSRVVSKYIGETEQNLSRLFARAENKDWILFFDEADALFSKRTEVRDSHDKYANQEVAYLLQRIESFNGLVILATNQRNNIDEAFVRRFQSVVHFPMPRADERLRLWTRSLPQQVQLSSDVNLNEISMRYEISGASILNIVHHCSIEALADASLAVDRKRLESAILREFVKEGKIV